MINISEVYLGSKCYVQGAKVSEEEFEKAAKNAGYTLVKEAVEYERPKSGHCLNEHGWAEMSSDIDCYHMFNIFPEGTDMERIWEYVRLNNAIILACTLVNAKSGFVPDWNDANQTKHVFYHSSNLWCSRMAHTAREGCGAAVGSTEDAMAVCKLLTEWGVT